MRTFVGRLPAIKRLPLVAVAHEDAEEAEEAIARLRAQGQCVVVDYGVGYNGSQDVSGRLKKTESGWEVFKI
jgi:ATP phosphoribosyltransferase, regulatory subunit